MILMERTIDSLILCRGGNLTTIPSSRNEKWEFTFYMDGIGIVKATPVVDRYYTYFSAPDIDAQGNWWHWEPRYDENGVIVDPHGYQVTTKHPIDGTWGSIMDALTIGNPGDTSPNNGLLNFNNNGNAVSEGKIHIRFNLTAESGFAFGGTTNNTAVGYFDLTIKAGGSNNNWDTEQKVIDNINAVLNGNTILDFKGTDGINSSQYSIGTASSGDTIQVPVYGTETLYGGVKNIHIQAGAEAGQYIDIEYESLNNWILGIEDTNTLTVEDASNAINEAKAALQKVSDQRSLFGAYQNRLEHAYNVNKNTEENTQASESLIRDTDIADTMMEFSINNILMQAGVSMLTQANQQGQIAMRLLQ